MIKNNKNFKILTTKGFESFSGVKKIKKDWYYHLEFTNGETLNCSNNHLLLTIDGFKKVMDIKKTDEIIFKDGDNAFLIKKIKINKKIYLYDLINTGSEHSYYTNNIVSHNCHFLGSVNTLISAKKLSEMAHTEPLETKENLDIYEYPNKKSIYMVTVDVSEGLGIDYSALVIIDITEIPYKVVGKYKSNQIKPLLFPTIIRNIAQKYNNAFVFIELNSLGTQVASILFHDLEYGNMLMCASRGRHGQLLGQGFSSNNLLGLKINSNTKKLGCSNLKALIEENKLLCTVFHIISEFTTYVETKGTYKAEIGYNDDLISALVVFSWASTQPYFRELTNMDIRNSIVESKLKELEEEFNIFGMYINGIDSNETEYDRNGDVWSTDTDFHKLNTNTDPLYEYGYTSTTWDVI